jgi:hypothetical protein
VDPASGLVKTLREHYQERRQRYGLDDPALYDEELLRLFAAPGEVGRRERAARFLRAWRGDILEPVSRWTGQTRYTVEQLLREMMARCRDLDLRLRRDRARTLQEVAVVLTMLTLNDLQRGRMRLFL